MNIGILGLGNVGGTLAKRLSAAGHDVEAANSRGPETIDADILSTGAHAVTAEDAVRAVDVLILALPFSSIPEVARLVTSMPEQTVVIDTSNYYPNRDGVIESVVNGQAESEWVVEQLSRPIVKAWNAVGSGTLADRALPAGHPDRIGLPIAGDDPRAKEAAAVLMSDSGFDPVDTGSLADSWRQQPGSPVYCTELRADDIRAALGSARRERLPQLREFAAAILLERAAAPAVEMSSDYAIRLNRMVYM